MSKAINIDTVEMEIHGENIYLKETTDVVLIRDGQNVGYYQNRIRIPSTKKGSHDLHVSTSHNGKKLLIEGCFYGFLHGQNVYTTDNLRSLCMKVAKKVNTFLKSHYGLKVYKQIAESIASGDIVLRRVDLAVNYRMDSETHADQILRNIKYQLVSNDSNFHGYGNSVLYSPRDGCDYSICLYAKGAQMRRKKSYVPQALKEDCKTILRFEVRLKSKELQKQGMETISNWGKHTPGKLVDFYIPRLKFVDICHNNVEDWIDEVLDEDIEAMSTTQTLIFDSWRKGILSRDSFTTRSWQRYKKLFLEKYRIDISTPVLYQTVMMDIETFLGERAIESLPSWIKPKTYLSN